jgi:hypothetical protein
VYSGVSGKAHRKGRDRMTTIIRAPKGSLRQEVDLDSVKVPDLWFLFEELHGKGDVETAEMVRECWHLAHDLLLNLKGDVAQ